MSLASLRPTARRFHQHAWADQVYILPESRSGTRRTSGTLGPALPGGVSALAPIRPAVSAWLFRTGVHLVRQRRPQAMQDGSGASALPGGPWEWNPMRMHGFNRSQPSKICPEANQRPGHTVSWSRGFRPFPVGPLASLAIRLMVHDFAALQARPRRVRAPPMPPAGRGSKGRKSLRKRPNEANLGNS